MRLDHGFPRTARSDHLRSFGSARPDGTFTLEAAVFRPQSGYYADVVGEAAALWESLSQNHPFIDGNKRTAFASMYTFLAINGVSLRADADSAWDFVSARYANGDFRFDRLEAWLRTNTGFA